MPNKKQVEKFVKCQRSIHLYKGLQDAFKDVLIKIPDDQYRKITKNLFIISLHSPGGLGQAMFFPNPNGEFKIIEIPYDKTMPKDVMRYVVAHEIGHICNGYMFPKKEETWEMLEARADAHALSLGFPKTKKIKNWYNALRSK